MARDLIPVGTLVQVTPMPIQERRPYRGIVRGYDMGRTKYHIGDEYMRDRFQERGSSWAFLSEVTPIDKPEEDPMALPTFEDMRRDAHRELGDVLDGMRSDWRPGTGPTDKQAEAFAEAHHLIIQAKYALDKAARN